MLMPEWPARHLGHRLIALLIFVAATSGASSDGLAQTWPELKCAHYQASWSEALQRRGKGGLSPAFLASHEAFIASGCTDQGHVCPRSDEELALANLMTIKSMNARTASTFLPFACPQ
jgi:hypothetical protein